MGKLKMLSLFSGIGSPEAALKNLGIDYELIGFSEIDKYAVKSYCEIHGVSDQLNLGDITEINIETLPNDVDLITHGSPCFPKGAKVLTDTGYKNIEDIKIGDKVLTHDNEYKKVYILMESDSSDLYSFTSRNTTPIIATGNHPFYVREKLKKWCNETRSYQRVWGKPEWKMLRELNSDYYCGVAINQESKLPVWDGVPDCRNNRKTNINNLSSLFTDERFWYLVGRYMGDGWTTIGFNKKENKPTYRTVICCGKSELDFLEDSLGGVLKYSVVEEETTFKLNFSNKELTLFLQQFGKGAANKKLNNTILDLPTNLLERFLDGYIDSDGCYNNGTYRISSVSEELLIGVGQVVAKVYGVPYSLSKSKRPNTHVINGRVVSQKDCYTLAFKRCGYKEGFVENGILWCPIREVKPLNAETTKVYNLEVEDSHSYTVNNIIVHNCQSFSVAGKNHGGDEGSGTRSSLMWNTVAIVEHCRPKYVIWENVKNVLSKKHKHNFDKYLDRMENLGYVNYYEVLNAKGLVPQNRERIFVVSIRKDVDRGYEFPTIEDNGLRLKDILEPVADEKFYVKNERAEKLISEYKGKAAIGYHLSSREFKATGWNEDNCPTLMARDYKDPKVVIEPIRLGGFFDDEKGKHQAGSVYDTEGVSPTLDTAQGGWRQPCIFTDAPDYRIRKLIPIEYWRLMGFSVEAFRKAEAVCSNTQLYKQAGNSIVVPVMELIFKNLLC